MAQGLLKLTKIVKIEPGKDEISDTMFLLVDSITKLREWYIGDEKFTYVIANREWYRVKESAQEIYQRSELRIL